MDRVEFKQRMQQLKSYREQNPDKGYWDWKRKIEEYKGLDIEHDDTYDYKGFYKENPARAYEMLNDNPNAHFTDKYKTPKHPTFSNESIYSNDVTPGGSWDYIDGRDVYRFSDYTFEHSDETLDYLNREDPSVVATYKGGVVLPEVEVISRKPAKYAEGGETGDKDSIVKALGEPNYSRPATEVPNNPYTGRPIATGAITTDDMETSIDMTPLGDIIAAKNLGEDLYNKQWLSAGLNALGLIPFVPNGLGKASKSMRFNTRVNRNLTSDAIDALDKRMAEYSKINSKIEKERSKINDIIKSPEAIRRIRNIDKLFGTSYDSAYSALIRDFNALRMANDTPFIKFATPPRESTLAFIKPSEGSTIMLNKNRINNVNDIYPGLTRHEMGHYVDYLAGDGITNNDYLLNLAKPSKFKPYNSLIPQFPSLSEDMYKNLRQGTEVKSYMNQFRDYLMDKGYKGNRLNLKTLEREIRNAPSTYDGTKMLFDMYKDPKQFRKDFNTIPLVNVERENTDNRYYA